MTEVDMQPFAKVIAIYSLLAKDETHNSKLAVQHPAQSASHQLAQLVRKKEKRK